MVLEKNAARAAELGQEIATRTEWIHADLRTWTPPRGQYDLVTSHFLHQSGQDLFRRLASAVRRAGSC